MSEPFWPIEEKALFRKYGKKYLTMSTKNKTAVFKSVEILYKGFIEWNGRHDNKGTIGGYLEDVIKEAHIVTESKESLKLKFYAYQRLVGLNWKPKKGIAFSRYREILTRDIEDKDRIDLLKKLENKKEKISAKEFREIIKSKRSRKSKFSELNKPIIYEDMDGFLTKIKDAISRCPAIPKGAIFYVKPVKKSLNGPPEGHPGKPAAENQ